MTADPAELLARRLAAQGLSTSPFATPADVVRGLGAVQAQEPPGAAWAIAQRMTAPDRDAVGAAQDAGEILRCHALRPTWHLLAREDLRWMQAATGARVERAVGTRYREFRLDAAELARTDALIEAVIRRDGARTRPELAAELAAAGIDTAEPVRVQHILLHAEVAALIVSGPMRGTQATYALVDDRAPTSNSLRPEQPLAELARRYLAGHGPATAADLAWWSGMTLTAARDAIAALGVGLRSDVLDGIEYWALADGPDAGAGTGILLLPAYDEFVVGYADRSLFTPDGFTGNPVFQNVIVRDGVIIGTWNPKVEGVAPELVASLSSAERAGLAAAIERYESYRR